MNSTDRDAWLVARQAHVTASDVAAMLSESPYKTREQLVLEKAGLADDNPGNEMMDLALALEPFVIEQANKRWGLGIRECGNLMIDSECPALAATPDAFFASPYGYVNAQIKCTRIDEFHKVKKYGGQPPLYWQLQVQAELACMGYQHGCLLVLHLAPLALRTYYIQRHDVVISRIRSEATKLMNEVAAIKEGRAA